MKLSIAMGQSSSGIRDERGDIIGSVDWIEKHQGFLISCEKLGSLHMAIVSDTAELRRKIEEQTGTEPDVVVMTAPLVIKSQNRRRA